MVNPLIIRVVRSWKKGNMENLRSNSSWNAIKNKYTIAVARPNSIPHISSTAWGREATGDIPSPAILERFTPKATRKIPPI